MQYVIQELLGRRHYHSLSIKVFKMFIVDCTYFKTKSSSESTLIAEINDAGYAASKE
jgi:hypothetical protein